MNKFGKRTVGGLVALAMAAGVGVAIGVSTKDAVAMKAGTETYQKVSSLSAGKEVLIVSHSSGGQYYLMDAVTGATGAGPKYITCSLANNVIQGDFDNHLFTVEASSTNWKFKTGTKYLKWSGTSSNTAIRINTGDSDNTWTYSAGTMKFSSATRYLGVYTAGTDWRSYNSSGAGNYDGTGTNIEFYEKAAAPADTYTVSFNANGGSGSMSNVEDVAGSYTLPDNGFTAPNNKAFTGWKANNGGDIIPAGGSFTVSDNVTFYAQWADAYTVTYSAGTNGSGSYAHVSQFAGNYTLLPFGSLTGVSPSVGYRFKDYTVGGVTKNPGDTITLNAATAVTVNFEAAPLGGTYDFTKNWDTYAAEWGSYGGRIVTGSDLGADYEASISFTNVSKQTGTNPILDRPVVAAKQGVTSTMLFALDSSVSAAFKITTVDVAFLRWSNTKKVGAALYKGTSTETVALDSFSENDAPKTLSTGNLNGDSFIVDFTTSQTNNQQLGISSITIGLEAKAAYGTTNHIKVTSFPNTIYHIGEAYDATGLAVTAYDGVDENTANYKDVTAEVVTGFADGYVFAENDVPNKEMSVKYTDNTDFFADPIVMHVYALAEYELVESAPADWSGSYLIVATDGKGGLRALNGSLVQLDTDGNHKSAPEKSTGIIENGQELEFTIATYSTGYSIQGKNGKYIGWAGTGTNNGLTLSDTPLVNAISYDDGTIIAGSGGKHLSFNSDALGRFRYYTSGTVQLYKLVESSDVSDFADMFLEDLSTGASAVCKYDPSTQTVSTNLADLKQAWKNLADLYDLLSPADKEQFRLGVPSTDSEATNVAKALALYDYIAGRYNTQLQGTGFVSNYDFMQRGIQPQGTAHLPAAIDSGSAVATIAVVSLISVAAIGGLFFYRKRRAI